MLNRSCFTTGVWLGIWLDSGSRMTRECHVRICERLRGKFPRPTRHFGAKAHIGVDSKETVVHSVVTSAASVADKHMLPGLLHGDERKVWGDGGYQGQTEAIHEAAPRAQDMTCRRTKYKDYVDEEAKRRNTTKARVRAKVEHLFRILKRVFGFTKVRYRGIWKNHQWLCAAFALVNLYQHRNRLAPQRA